MGLRAPGPAALPPLIGEEPNFGQLIQQGNLPVPQQTQLQPEATFGQMFQEPAQEPVAPEREPAAETPLTPEQEEALTQFDLAPDQEAALSQFEITPDASPVQQEIRKAPFFTRFVRRLFASAGGNLKEEASILKNMVGSKATVKIKGDKILIKEKGAKEFVDFDPSSGGFPEFLIDTFADSFGSIFEAGVAGLAEAGIIAAATGTTLGLGTPAAVGLGVPIATAVGKAARVGLTELFGGDVDMQRNFTKEVFVESGLNLVTMGVFSGVLKPAFTAAKKKTSKMLLNSTLGRLGQQAQFKVQLKNMLESIAPAIPRSEVKDNMFGLLDTAHKTLSDTVGVFKSSAIKAEAKTGIKSQAETVLEKIREVLGDRVTYGKGGRVTELPGGLEAEVVYGSELGINHLEFMADKYNSILEAVSEKGGVSFKTLDNLTKVFQSRSSFAKGAVRDITKDIPKEAMVDYRVISNAMSSDRLSVMQKLLPESSEAIERGMKEFSQKVGPLGEAKQLFKQSGKKFEPVLFDPTDSSALELFKKTMGENSKEWGLLKSRFVTDLYEKSINPANNLLDEKIMFANIKKFKGDTMDLFMSKKEQMEFTNIARKVSLVGKGGILKEEEGVNLGKALFNVVAAPLIGLRLLPGTKTRSGFNIAKFIYSTGKNNKEWIDLVTDRSLLELAQEADTAAKKDAILQARTFLSDFLEESTVVTIKGKAKYVAPRRLTARLAAGEPPIVEAPPQDKEPFVGPPQEGLSPELEQSIQGL